MKNWVAIGIASDVNDLKATSTAGGFNEAPGQVQRACLPEGPDLSFPFLLSLIVRKVF